MKKLLLLLMLVSGLVYGNDELDKAQVEIKVLKHEVKLLTITNKGYRKKIKKLEKKLKNKKPKVHMTNGMGVVQTPRIRFITISPTHNNNKNIHQISDLKNKIMKLEEQMDRNNIKIRQGKIKYAHMKSVYLKKNKKMLISKSAINAMKKSCYSFYWDNNKIIKRTILRYKKRIAELEALNKKGN